ncbi:MAG: adenosylcobinamide-phosphate synthase CbiB [Chloroflexota bacterium]
MKRILLLFLALIIDFSWGDPPNQWHPVVLIGRWLNWGRRIAPGGERRFWFGASWVSLGVVLFTLPFWRSEQGKPARSSTPLFLRLFRWVLINPLFRVLFTLLSRFSFILHLYILKSTFAYRGLRQAMLDVAEALSQNDLDEARRLVSWHLVSRDTSQLSETELIGAAIESLAENLTDSMTAPLLAYAVGGLPVAVGYRFINTADAMWGYRTEEFEQLGKFAAETDDLLNWLPARLTGWLLVAAAWLVGEDAENAAKTMLNYHRQTPSPNAGWTMSAMAGALQVTLTKREVYALNGGQAVLDVQAIHRAILIADSCVGLLLLIIGVGTLLNRKQSKR